MFNKWVASTVSLIQCTINMRTALQMKRPDDLADFSEPPLNEVVIGVQFDPIEGFCAVNLGEVYELYSGEYPKVEEHPPLEPRIETFGGLRSSPQVTFDIGPPPIRPRLWFKSDDDDHLLQIQEDRFFLNWRRRSNGGSYPHFEGVLEKFDASLSKLAAHFLESAGPLKINQAEVTYVNIIPVHDFDEIGDWICMVNSMSLGISSATISVEDVIHDDDNNPIARFFVDLNSVFTSDRKEKAYRLNLTVRGRPALESKDSISVFLLMCRRKIVETFELLATENAKKKWGKI